MSRTAPATIDEYIAGFPPDVQAILEQIRLTIQKAAPQAVETISYRIPTFDLNGHLVHFAAYRQHIGFYPASSGIEKFKKEISAYASSRGAVQFPLDEPIPLALITRMVRFRVKENLARAGTREKKK